MTRYRARRYFPTKRKKKCKQRKHKTPKTLKQTLREGSRLCTMLIPGYNPKLHSLTKIKSLIRSRAKKQQNSDIKHKHKIHIKHSTSDIRTFFRQLSTKITTTTSHTPYNKHATTTKSLALSNPQQDPALDSPLVPETRDGNVSGDSELL